MGLRLQNAYKIATEIYLLPRRPSYFASAYMCMQFLYMRHRLLDALHNLAEDIADGGAEESKHNDNDNCNQNKD